MYKKLLVSILLLCFSLAFGVEQSAGIEVVGTRLGSISNSLENYPGNVDLYTAEDIAQSGSTSLVDFLQNQSGISFISDMAGAGTERTGQLSMRGFSAEKNSVLVLVDGVKINDPNNNRIYWEQIALSNIEKIEVLKGGSSTLYGSSALAGVISITTKKGKSDSVAVSVGGYGEQEFSLNKSLIQGDSYNVGLNYNNYHTDGFRKKAGYDSEVINLYSNIVLTKKDLLDLSFTSSRSSYGFAGYSPDYDAYLNSPHQRQGNNGEDSYYEEGSDGGSLGYTKIFTDKVRVQTKLSSLARVQDSDFDNAGVGISRTKMHQNNIVSEVVISDVVGKSLIFGGEYGDVFATKEELGAAGAPSNTNFVNSALFLENKYQFNHLEMVFGYRVDNMLVDYDDIVVGYDAFWNPIYESGKLIFRGYSPKAAFSYDLGKNNSLFASWSKSFKAPPQEDFTTAISPYESNTEIEPQVAEQFEFGGTQQWTKSLLSKISLFQIQVNDEIFYDPTGWQNENVDTVHRGVEISGEKKFAKSILSIGYTANEAYFNEDTGSFKKGNAIPLIPDYKWDVSLLKELSKKSSLHLTGLYMGPSYALNNVEHKERKEAGYGIVNVGLSHKANNALSFRGDIDNLLDERYSAYTGYSPFTSTFKYVPAAGRTAKFSVKYNF